VRVDPGDAKVLAMKEVSFLWSLLAFVGRKADSLFVWRRRMGGLCIWMGR
jgi:hypothetical protein